MRGRSSLLPQRLQLDLVVVGQLAHVRGERGTLQERDRALDRVSACAVERRVERAVRSDQHRRRDQQLGHVDVDSGWRRAERRDREVDEYRLPVDDHDVTPVEPAVRHARGVELGDLLPQRSEQLVGHGARRGVLERVDVGPAGHDERVPLRAERGCHHLGHAHPRLRGHHRRQRLVLDLLEPAHGCAPPRVPVRKRTPTARDPLCVLCIPPEHPDVHGAALAVVTDVLRAAEALAFCRSEVAGLDPEHRELGPDRLGRREARRCSEHEADDRPPRRCRVPELRAPPMGARRRARRRRARRGARERPPAAASAGRSPAPRRREPPSPPRS